MARTAMSATWPSIASRDSSVCSNPARSESSSSRASRGSFMSASFRRGAEPLENPDLPSWQQRNGTGIGAAHLGADEPFETLYASVHGFCTAAYICGPGPLGVEDASGQEAVEDLPGHGVALARRALQTGSVDD